MTAINPTNNFVQEMNMKAVIDTNAQKLAGKTWLENYMKNLDDTLLNQTEISESHKIFKFGESNKVIVTLKAKLPE